MKTKPNGYMLRTGSDTPKQAGLRGGRNKSGASIVYIDGQPVVLQRIAADTGLTVERLAERVRAARKRGEPVTMELLTKPLRVQASPGPRKMSGFVITRRVFRP